MSISLESCRRTTEPQLGALVDALAKCLDGCGFSFHLFGSRAVGRSRHNSDWDIGILGPRRLTPRERARMAAVIEEWPTLHTIDLVDLAAASERFRAAVLEGSVRLARRAA